ncbi:MAG: 16S rRNA (guanine(966)-N(2))-methyltransferase RsmD, partial [Bacilli bacterium]
VISGNLKGKNILGFDINGTRPTMDRVKESLFAMIQDYVKDSVVLDLYTGSGNLAIEALSNGAKEAYLVDNSRMAIEVVNKNLKSCNITRAIVIKNNSISALNSFILNKMVFDIIFLDPPYITDEINKVLTIINGNLQLLTVSSIVVCETEKHINYSVYDNFKVLKEKKYGNKIITILQTN